MKGPGVMFSAVAVLLGQGSVSSPSVEPTGPQYTLNAGDAHQIEVPNFSFGANACDAVDQVFFDTSDNYSKRVLLRVNGDGSDPTPFLFPSDPGQHGLWSFAVSATGEIYFLLANVQNPVLIRASTSGDEVSRTHLSLPVSVTVHSFAVQPNGSSLIVGSIHEVTSGPGTGKPPSSNRTDASFLFWLDVNGNLVKREEFGTKFDRSVAEPNAVVALGSSGVYYVATDTAISQFDEAGNVSHVLVFASLNKASRVQNLRFLNGRVAVAFSYPPVVNPAEGKQQENTSQPYFGPLDQAWLLADMTAGEVKGYYKSPPAFIGTALCYSGRNSFLYYTVRDRRPSLIRADL